MPLNFPYYYGHAGEQYAFFRIPKLLITDSRFDGVSSDAKLLYLRYPDWKNWISYHTTAWGILHVQSLAQSFVLRLFVCKLCLLIQLTLCLTSQHHLPQTNISKVS